MNKLQMIDALAGWIKGLKEAAADDEQFLISWFIPTKNSKFSIVGGWEDGYDPKDQDLFCLSHSNPTYGMAVKVVENNGPYAYCDFETMDMPIDKNGEVDDTSITLEYNDDPKALAAFFYNEWERITKEYTEV